MLPLIALIYPRLRFEIIYSETLRPALLNEINLSYTKRNAFRFNGNYTSAITDVPRKHKNAQEVVWVLC